MLDCNNDLALMILESTPGGLVNERLGAKEEPCLIILVIIFRLFVTTVDAPVIIETSASARSCAYSIALAVISSWSSITTAALACL